MCFKEIIFTARTQPLSLALRLVIMLKISFPFKQARFKRKKTQKIKGPIYHLQVKYVKTRKQGNGLMYSSILKELIVKTLNWDSVRNFNVCTCTLSFRSNRDSLFSNIRLDHYQTSIPTQLLFTV